MTCEGYEIEVDVERRRQMPLWRARWCCPNCGQCDCSNEFATAAEAIELARWLIAQHACGRSSGGTRR